MSIMVLGESPGDNDRVRAMNLIADLSNREMAFILGFLSITAPTSVIDAVNAWLRKKDNRKDTRA